MQCQRLLFSICFHSFFPWNFTFKLFVVEINPIHGLNCGHYQHFVGTVVQWKIFKNHDNFFAEFLQTFIDFPKLLFNSPKLSLKSFNFLHSTEDGTASDQGSVHGSVHGSRMGSNQGLYGDGDPTMGTAIWNICLCADGQGNPPRDVPEESCDFGDDKFKLLYWFLKKKNYSLF